MLYEERQLIAEKLIVTHKSMIVVAVLLSHLRPNLPQKLKTLLNLRWQFFQKHLTAEVWELLSKVSYFRCDTTPKSVLRLVVLMSPFILLTLSNVFP